MLKSTYLVSHLNFVADVLALLLTDVLVFLQEKDQRFIFAAVVSCGTEKNPLVLFFHHLFTSLYGFLSATSGPKASCNPSAEAHS